MCQSLYWNPELTKWEEIVIISLQKGHTIIDYINIGHLTSDKCVCIKSHHTITEGIEIGRIEIKIFNTAKNE